MLGTQLGFRNHDDVVVVGVVIIVGVVGGLRRHAISKREQIKIEKKEATEVGRVGGSSSNEPEFFRALSSAALSLGFHIVDQKADASPSTLIIFT